MGALVKLNNSLKRRLSPTLKTMYQAGYINDELQRTKDGIHTILNFLETKFEKEFVAYLKELNDEKVEEAKEDCGQ